MHFFLSQVTTSNAAHTLEQSGGNMHQYVLMGALIVVMVVVLVAAIVLHKAFKTIIQVTMPELEQQIQAEKHIERPTLKEKVKKGVAKIMGLRPLSEEEDLVIDHAYDGIKELDNPTPAWFMGLFYVTIAFGIGYLVFYYVFDGPNQEQEYEQEMLMAENQRKAFLETQANSVDENSVEIDVSVETLSEGKAIFSQNCMACHGAAGEGGIGPNLTDDYWLHGGTIKHVFKTIKYGVPDKGMIAWEQQLSPVQIAQVANYILSIHGTNPANAKAPQGELVEQTKATTEQAE